MSLTNQIREKYLTEQIGKYGADQLSDYELFTMLLSQFCSQGRAQKIARTFLDENKNFSQINYLTSLDWNRYFDQPSQTQKILVICEFVKRCRYVQPLIQGQITSCKMIGQHLIEKLKYERQELLYGIYLDTKNQIICEKLIFKGTLDSATVHPREIFRVAVQYAAARVIVAHNHPSGNTEPSKNDQQITDRLIDCGELLGIEFLDHLIIGNDDFFSFRAADLI